MLPQLLDHGGQFLAQRAQRGRHARDDARFRFALRRGLFEQFGRLRQAVADAQDLLHGSVVQFLRQPALLLLPGSEQLLMRRFHSAPALVQLVDQQHIVRRHAGLSRDGGQRAEILGTVPVLIHFVPHQQEPVQTPRRG